MFTLNLFLDKDVMEKMFLVLCPSTIGLKDINATKCKMSKENGKVCELCWRKAIMRQNRKVEASSKRKLTIIEANKDKDKVDTTQWCIECGCRTVHVDGVCIACGKDK